MNGTKFSGLLSSRQVLLLAGFMFFIASCEKENVQPEEELPPEEETVEIPGNKLPDVISEDNYWGGKVITEVDRVMTLLRSTRYTLSSYVVDVEGGRLDVDCSKYVETILKEASLPHYLELPKSSSSGKTSLAKDYYNHFVTLPSEPDGVHGWIRIHNLADARPGDIISYIHAQQGTTTGHVMIICSDAKPSDFNPTEYSLVINDSANSGHFGDTRNNEGIYADDYQYLAYMYVDGGVIKFSGVGIGAMWFCLDADSYYRWNSPTGSKVYKNIAIGRMIDLP